MSAEILKTHCDTETASLKLKKHAEHCIAVQSCNTLEMHRGLCLAAQDRDATILSQFVFAGTEHYDEFCKNAKPSDWPVVWLQGDACECGDIYSMQGVALSGINPQPIHFNGRDMGFTYEDDHAKYCRLRGVIPQDLTASRMEQTRSAFETMDAALKLNGFKFTDTVRTWIYLDNLLEWYDDFNVVRTQYFNETGIFDHMVPASTGIGAGNQFDAAIMMDVLAVKPKNDVLKIYEVVSPLQNPALDYKSSFSRAVEMVYPTHRNLLISGTASIDPEGATVYLDDPEKQIRLTLDVVHAILESRGMGWGDLFRGIAYFKNMDYLPIYEQVAAELKIPRFPLAISHADVCRDDLLFEVEVDAVQPAK
ncbi:RidA family protein [Tichowtungia aerotolerans]|uniref:Translation initiation inhibitor n=1 Tax=Tichowtungia aerotolerans TaxID=2697043 RepID=A0A6P1MDE8_9BACT|nr:RidA family protein [Tichowtungia aerotolerans]QHI70594.1 translation initiation inhibitor [Tichowtungia aerotolerans]